MTAREQLVDPDRVAPGAIALGSLLSRRAALQGLGGAGLALGALAAAARFAPSAAADHTSAPRPNEMVAAYVAAVNARDLDAILALYAEDAIHVALPTADGSGGVCRGRADYTIWYERALEDGIRIEVVPGSVAVDGPRATFALRTATASWTALGLGPLAGTAEIAVADGAIRTHVVMLAPEAVRQLLAAQGVAPEERGYAHPGRMRGA